MEMDLIMDIITFNQLLGACNELAERDFRNAEIMDDDYKESIQKYIDKYDVEIELETIDDYFHAEDVLFELFLNKMVEA